MKKLIVLIGLILLVVLTTGCAAGRTFIVADTQTPPDKPPIDLRLGIFNDSNRWLKIEGLMGFETLILGPQKETVLVFKRLGYSEAIVHAYRSMEMAKGKSPRLRDYIATKEVRIRLNGTSRQYRGNHFGNYIRFKDNDFRYREGGYRFSTVHKYGPVTIDLFGDNGRNRSRYGSRRRYK